MTTDGEPIVRLPLAFILSDSPRSDRWMKGAGSNGFDGKSSFPVLKDVSKLLRQLGFATVHVQQLGEALVAYRRSLSQPGFDPQTVLLLGACGGANLIARAYFEFFAIRPPDGVVLLSPVIRAAQLGNLTCPYLIVHGEDDPQFQYQPYSDVQEAVRHHQMRYGDLTTSYLAPWTGAELGTRELNPQVREQLSYWVRNLIASDQAGRVPA